MKIKQTLSLGWHNLRYRWKAETAYFGNNWSNMFSTTAYTATTLIGLSIVYTKVPSIAGVDRNQMFFIFLIGQIAFYISMVGTTTTISKLADDIRTGRFDMMLVRPQPIVWGAITSNTSLLGLVRDGLPALIPYIFLLRPADLGVEFTQALAGVGIFICGVIFDVCLFHALALTTVWHQADETALRTYSFVSRNSNLLPYSAYPVWFRALTFVFFPSFIAAVLASTVALGLMGTEWLVISFVAAVVSLVILRAVLNMSIKAYGSASS